MSYRRTSLRSKAVAVPLTVLLAGFGMSACTNDTADDEARGDVPAVEEPLEDEPLEDEGLAEEPIEDEGLVAEPHEDDPVESVDPPEALVYGDTFDVESFVGEPVVVEAEVVELVAPGIFMIGGETAVDPLLVVADPAADLEVDSEVRVKGTVHRYDPADLGAAEDVLGSAFDPTLFEDYEEAEPYLVATAIDPVAR